MKILIILLLPLILFAQPFTEIKGDTHLNFIFQQSSAKEIHGYYKLGNGQLFPFYRDVSYILLLIPAKADSISISDIKFGRYKEKIYNKNTVGNSFAGKYRVLSAKCYQGRRYFPVRIYPAIVENESIRIPEEISFSIDPGRISEKSSKQIESLSDQFAKKMQTNNPYSDWYRFTLEDNAVYKVTKTDIDNWNINADNPESLHFFSFNGQVLPYRTNTGFPTAMPELQIYITNHVPGDGWNADEVVYIYARGVNFFHYDSLASEHTFHHNFYANQNYLWLAVDGSVSSDIVQVINKSNPSSSQDHAFTYDHIEKDEVNRLKSGTTWFENGRGQAGNPHIINLDLDNDLICYTCANPKLDIHLSLAGGNRFLYHDENGFRHYFDVDFINGQDNIPLVSNFLISNANFETISTSYQLNNQLVDPGIQIIYTPVPTAIDGSVSPELGKYFFDFYELSYPVKLINLSEQIYLTQDFSETAITLDFTNIPDNAYLWNITNSSIPVVSTVSGDDDFIPYFEKNKKNSFLYVTSINAPGLPTPENVSYNHHLRDINNIADLIIVSPGIFYERSMAYAQAREEWSTDPFSAEVVLLEDIYNEFSAGVKDPGAIRNYLKYCWENRTYKPSCVLLMGDGNYDPREIIFKGKDRDLIPTFQIDDEREISSFTTDFYFADLNVTSSDFDNIEPEIPLGRLPVSSETEIDNYIDKLQNYGQLSQSNGWEQDFLLIADDLDAGDSHNEVFHFEGAENIFAITPQRYNVFKLYLEKYPAVSGGIGRIKPTATTEFLNKVNQGQSIVIYIGHGAPDKWAHETLYDLKLHRDLISNSYTNGLWMALSCDISKFDDPGRPTMGEDLVNRNKSGSMWVFAATRLVLAYQNNALGVRIIQWLLTKPEQYSVGEALTLAVQDYSVSNTLRYILFGDPSLPLLEGRIPITFENVDDLDTLRSLQIVNITGYVGANPDAYPDFNGNAVLRAYDTEDSLTHPGFFTEEWYSILGPSLYKGQLVMNNGSFNAQFIVPKSIKYSQTPKGKIWLYAWEPESGIKASAFLNNVVFYGSSGNTNDFDGPTISISIDEINFGVEGDLIPQNSELFVYLTDSSGINVSGEVGHEITMWVDEKEKADLTDFFVYDANSAFQGQIKYPLNSLSEGKHSFNLKAWDNANNPTDYSFNFEIVKAGEITLKNVVNYPNPMRNETWFTCQTSAAVGKIEIYIFSLSGRKVRSLYKNIDQIDFQRVFWDGRDEFGNTLANGTYLYHFKLTSGQFKLSKTEKLVIIN